MFSTIIDKVTKFRVKVHPYFQNKFLLFFIIASSQVIDNVNVTGYMSNVEFIEEKYGVEYALASWTLSAYSVAFASFIAFFGRVADIVGHQKTFVTGLFFLGIFSIITAVVDNIYVIIVFRALQGLAASATVPPSFAIIANSFTGKSLNIALGALSGILVISFGIGIILGGAFAETSIGYKGIGWVTTGCAFLCCAASFFALKPIEQKISAGSLHKLDYIGVFIFISAAILLVTGFTEAGESWKKPRAYVPIIVSVLLFLFFFLWETVILTGKRAKNIDLFVPKKMWKIRNFKSLPVTALLLYGSFFCIILISVEYARIVVGNSPIISAVKIIPFFVTLFIFTIIFSLIYGKYLSPKWCCFTGIVLALVGSILLTRMRESNTSYWKFGLPGFILAATGLNLYFINYLNLITLATPLEMQGLISGICLTMGQLGTAIFFSVITSLIGNSDLENTSFDELNKRYNDSYYLAVSGCAVCIFISFFFVKNLKGEVHPVINDEDDDDSADAFNPAEDEDKEKSAAFVALDECDSRASNATGGSSKFQAPTDSETETDAAGIIEVTNENED